VAKATITLEDNEDGIVNVTMDFDPPLELMKTNREQSDAIALAFWVHQQLQQNASDEE
jgi:hypothetical protein